MHKINIPVQEAREIVFGDSDYKIIQDKIIGTSRWSIKRECIFQKDGKYYKVQYQVGATESQDEGPFEYEHGDIQCIEVEPKEVTVIEYVPVA